MSRAVHLTIGIALLMVILVQAYRRKFGPFYYTPVEMSGLYWHFVDIIWIFLFPLDVGILPSASRLLRLKPAW